MHRIKLPQVPLIELEVPSSALVSAFASELMRLILRRNETARATLDSNSSQARLVLSTSCPVLVPDVFASNTGLFQWFIRCSDNAMKMAPPTILPKTAADWLYHSRRIVDGAPYIRPSEIKNTV
jgi:hypothetical protein